MHEAPGNVIVCRVEEQNRGNLLDIRQCGALHKEGPLIARQSWCGKLGPWVGGLPWAMRFGPILTIQWLVIEQLLRAKKRIGLTHVQTRERAYIREIQ
eukprot:COSAG06_NODE_8990_length_2017_cov_16.215328_2_plen_98_part_00